MSVDGLRELGDASYMSRHVSESDLLNVFGRNMKRIRKEQGHTLASMSAAVGCTESYIARMEAGDANISLQRVERVAYVLGVAPLVLLED